MLKNTLILYAMLFFSLAFNQNADLVTQKIQLENAMREKVDFTLSRQLDPSQYIIVVNARLDFKPLSLNSDRSTKTKKYESSSYTFIPGLDMPSIPTDQTIYKPNSNSDLSGYKYSSSLLYGLEIIIYLDKAITTPSLQQNLKNLVQTNIPEIVDCQDCVQFKTLDILNSENRPATINDRIAELEQEKIAAEKELQNWRFNQLEEQLAVAQDARGEWEEQARNRERMRRIDDSTRMANLEKIERVYRAKQDSLYVLNSIKLDEAIRGRIQSEENTKEELLNIIKLQIQGEGAGDLSSDTEASILNSKRPLSSGSFMNGKNWLLIILIIALLMVLLIVVLRNKQPIYLKPKTPSNPGSGNANTPQTTKDIVNEVSEVVPTQAHSNDDVLKSELHSLRQSAVSMSVSEKAGANQIVKDWLDDKVDSDEENNSNNEE